MEEFQKMMLEIIRSQQEQSRMQQEAILTSQREFLEKIGNVFTNPASCANNGTEVSEEFRMETLGNAITEFQFDPSVGLTFDEWFKRYESLFNEDAQKLSDAAKVRLILRKINTICHQQYVNYILPKESKDITFAETVNLLKHMFGKKITLFHTRYNCLQVTKDKHEDIIAYAARVNKQCEDFQINKISSDEFKCLIFVCGLQSHVDADFRCKLLSCIDNKTEKTNLTLQYLVNECQHIKDLKNDTAMIEGSKSLASVCSVQKQIKKQHNQAKPEEKNQNPLCKEHKIPKTACWFCGQMHFAKLCSYKNHKCQKCDRTGHKEGYCDVARNKRKSYQGNCNYKNKSTNSVTQANHINNVGKRKFATILINGIPIRLQIDTASDITIISKQSWENLGKPKCQISDVRPRDASKHVMNLIGEFQCSYTFRNQTYTGTCWVSPRNNLQLLGIDWISRLGMWDVPINTICNKIAASPKVSYIQSFLEEFPDIFSKTLGHCKLSVDLKVCSTAVPVFRPKRSVPYAALSEVDNELQRLQELGIISPVEYSEWAAPIVVTKKSNGTVRICGDYSTGLNDALLPHQFPLPIPEEIFAKLSGSTIFSIIDLSDAFLQVPVTEASRKYLTINTHRGLFQYNRLPFGVKVAPTAFQQIMDTMTAGLTGTAAYIDDIIVYGKNEQEHQQNLLKVFQRIREFGLRVKAEKCNFCTSQIKYLGHLIDKQGIRPDPYKTEAISSMPAPHDIITLRSYLGAINYYSKFVKSMHELRQPLNELLKKNSRWNWTEKCQKSFDKFKEILQSDLLLTHYDPSQEIIVAADASNTGLGACILHKFQDGSVKPIYHISRTLTDTEKRYSQIEKEGLALIFAVTKFHKMIYGRHFTLQTDHKPLLAIFGAKKGIPVHVANRLQRWALILKTYDFEIKYIKTEDFGYADLLSRLINIHTVTDSEIVIASVTFETEINQILQDVFEALPITFKMVQAETSKCPTLKQVMSFTQQTWPTNRRNFNKDLQIFYQRRESLSVVQGCLLMGNRVVIPFVYQKRILEKLHKGHPGQERMKMLARSYVYWPNIDKDIVSFVQHCENCALASKSSVREVPSSWPESQKPWERIHIDFAGPKNDYYFVVIMDAFSKWPEVFHTKSITASWTINILEDLIARYGLPETIVSDNGTQFTCEKFKEFCRRHGIQHITTAPYMPQSNGQAERFVDTLKRSLKKLDRGEAPPLNRQLQIMLSTYRTTPNRITPENKTPAEVFLGRKVKTTFDLLQPPVKSNQQTEFIPKRKQFNPDDKVYVKKYKKNKYYWVPAQVIERVGNVMYNVSSNNKLLRIHINQMRPRRDLMLPLPILLETQHSIEQQEHQELDNFINRPESQEVDEHTTPASFQGVLQRRPCREKRLPSYLQDYQLS